MRWGRVLIIITGLAGILFFVSTINDKYISRLWVGLAFVLLLVILIIVWLEVTRRMKQNLSKLVSEAEHIKGRLTGSSEQDLDRYNDMINMWWTKLPKIKKINASLEVQKSAENS